MTASYVLLKQQYLYATNEIYLQALERERGGALVNEFDVNGADHVVRHVVAHV